LEQSAAVSSSSKFCLKIKYPVEKIRINQMDFSWLNPLAAEQKRLDWMSGDMHRFNSGAAAPIQSNPM